MTNRKLQALRNLAERPGTEAEGVLAREILDRWESKRFADLPAEERPHWKSFEDYLRGNLSMDDFLESMRRRAAWERGHPPTTWNCACGNTVATGKKCHGLRHASIQQQIRQKFSKGDLVYYNYWAYSLNSAAIVQGYVRPAPENASFPWAWIRLKFHHLKTARNAPIHSAKGWHLSKAPLDPGEANRLART